MKMCNAEIMKKVKMLEQTKIEVLTEEALNNQVSYQKEADRYDLGYSFAATRARVGELDAEIRKLKDLLNVSNATTRVEEFSMTLGECLVYLAQLNRELATVNALANKQEKSSTSVYGGAIEYTVLNYDKAEARACLEGLKETIAKLQIAIDRTNLTNVIDVPL